jgi:hypothetical protein
MPELTPETLANTIVADWSREWDLPIYSTGDMRLDLLREAIATHARALLDAAGERVEKPYATKFIIEPRCLASGCEADVHRYAQKRLEAERDALQARVAALEAARDAASQRYVDETHRHARMEWEGATRAAEAIARERDALHTENDRLQAVHVDRNLDLQAAQARVAALEAEHARCLAADVACQEAADARIAALERALKRAHDAHREERKRAALAALRAYVAAREGGGGR